MAQKTKPELRSYIDTYIDTNGVNDITGEELNDALNDMVDSFQTIVDPDEAAHVDFDTSSTSTDAVGRMVWNDSDGTVNLGMKGGNVVLQIGQELYYPLVVNKEGSTMINGTVVMVDPSDPAQGQRLRVIKSITDGTYPSKLVVGVLTEDISNNADGFSTWFGYVRDLSISALEAASLKSGSETWADGDILYTSGTLNGGMTNIEPTPPSLKIPMAVVVNVTGDNVDIFVRPDLGSNIDELHNVDISSPTTGDILVKNGTHWYNTKTLPGDYSITGTVSIGKLRVTSSALPPANDSDTGVAGEIRIDSTYLYICVGTNAWRRVAISSWSA